MKVLLFLYLLSQIHKFESLWTHCGLTTAPDKLLDNRSKSVDHQIHYFSQFLRQKHERYHPWFDMQRHTTIQTAHHYIYKHSLPHMRFVTLHICHSGWLITINFVQILKHSFWYIWSLFRPTQTIHSLDSPLCIKLPQH